MTCRRSAGTAGYVSQMPAAMPCEAAMTASADSIAVRSHQLEIAYPPPSCSAFHGRNGSSECAVITCGTPYSTLARYPARFAYQVWECTRSAPATAAVIDRSVEITCSAELLPARGSHRRCPTAAP